MKKTFFIIAIISSLISIPATNVLAEETLLNPRPINYQMRKLPCEINFPNFASPTNSQVAPFTFYDLGQAKTNLNRLVLRNVVLSQ